MENAASYNEKELLQKVAEGDEKAFRVLFDNYHHLLSHHIFQLTESRDLADDIVQEVFIKVWMIRESLTEVEHFKAWLYVLSKNKVFDALRRIARQRVKQQQFEKDILPENDPAQYDPALLDLVDQAVAALPQQQKKVYLLSRHEGMRYEDIAKEMNISHETVKYYMKLALASIAKTLKAHAGLPALLLLLARI